MKKINRKTIVGALVVWTIFSALVTGGALLMGTSSSPEDAAEGIPMGEALPFFLFMLVGVPVLLILGILGVALFALMAAGSSRKKNVTIEIDGETYTGTVEKKEK